MKGPKEGTVHNILNVVCDQMEYLRRLGTPPFFPPFHRETIKKLSPCNKPLSKWDQLCKDRNSSILRRREKNDNTEIAPLKPFLPGNP